MANIEPISVGQVHYLKLSAIEFERLLVAMTNVGPARVPASPSFDPKIIDLDAELVAGIARGPFAMPPVG